MKDYVTEALWSGAQRNRRSASPSLASNPADG